VTSGAASGYRIVLLAGDRRFIYHTDFTRLIPCAEQTGGDE
jgi:hypothetical protein